MCQVVEVVAIQIPQLLLLPQATKYLNIGQAVHPFILSQRMHHQDAIVSRTLEDHQQQRIPGTKVFVQEGPVLDQGIISFIFKIIFRI